jgi:sugar lactone lactonase YvrE
MLLTAHKLLALCVAALLVVTALRVNGSSPLALVDWAVVASAGVLWIAAAASGGVTSARETAGRRIRIAHRVTAVLTVLASAAALYVLLARM